jgi:peptide-methionine (S)-S-oxide reductase
MTGWRTAIAAGAIALAACSAAQAAEGAFNAPAATRVAHETKGLKTAIFSGGCFWGVEAVFSHVKGVTSAVSGYRGGRVANPSYEQVSTGSTGHAESVRVTYDPAVVRYDQLLRVFFSVVADPTLKNRQGPDEGTQYRAALVPLSPEQKAVAQAYLAQMRASGVWKQPIVTQVEAAGPFYPAEGYHQDFIKNNPTQGYIVRWDLPKVAALKNMFPTLYSPAFKTG